MHSTIVGTRVTISLLACLMLGMLFIGATPQKENGQFDWNRGGDRGGDQLASNVGDDDGPYCYGNTSATRSYDRIRGKATMWCTAAVLTGWIKQEMTVTLRKCTWWLWGACLRTTHEETLASPEPRNSPGEWSTRFLSNDLALAGWYRAVTKHKVTWATGSEIGYSASVWIRID